ncbi:DegT/DnrJ/EryC1/StrS family aminotransferase [Dongia sp.]|uniref:DegT/DnrJ/EryC1/StrS family aminotransferase n=1 Tax=Dongia sp. TaxID=1977262 RepID=UPI0035B4B0FD
MVPFLDLKSQYAAIKPDVDKAVIDVLESGQYVLGPAVARFEAAFGAAYGIKHAIGCSSGTAALHLALLAAGIGRGDEVITTTMTFIATATAIDLVGATPVFADIEPDTALLDAGRIAAAITPRTKAIMPVHLYGQCADMGAIQRIADQHGLIVIEDAAQAHGAKLGDRFAGTMGRMSCFSFYPGKNLGAYGEGGLVATSDDALATRLRMLRDWGQDRKYNHVIKGLNYRMDGVQGAVLDIKMRHIEAWTEARRQVAAWYQEALGNTPGITLPVERAGRRHVWHVYGILVAPQQREAIMAGLTARGIGTNLHYPTPVHLQPCFAELGRGRGSFPLAEHHGAAELSLPMFPEMTRAQVDEVAKALREVMAEVTAKVPA